ncbi:MAG TPA: phage holin family protein [Anaeromyxobacteraceae bacterium]
MGQVEAEGTTAQREDPQLRDRSVKDLVTEIAQKASLLARKEVALAKAEVKEQLRAEVKMASGLGVAGVCALLTLNLLLMAGVLALAEAEIMRGWVAALLVGLTVLLIGTVAGLLGWRKRVREPLPATRRSVGENVRWAKERMA